MEKDNSALIGRKIKGFRFEGAALHYNPYMDKYIGVPGVIDEYNRYNESVRVYFEPGLYGNWQYPVSLIHDHLIPEEPSFRSVRFFDKHLIPEEVKEPVKEVTSEDEVIKEIVRKAFLVPHGNLIDIGIINRTELAHITAACKEYAAQRLSSANEEIAELKQFVVDVAVDTTFLQNRKLKEENASLIKQVGELKEDVSKRNNFIDKLAQENESNKRSASDWASKSMSKHAELIAERQKSERLLDLLSESVLQIEYLQNKFQETGSGNSLLSRLNSAIASYESNTKEKS